MGGDDQKRGGEFWERWRREISDQHPEVQPEYANRLGVWHGDFMRDKPSCGENGKSFYPSQYYGDSGAEFSGGFTKRGLVERGWTRTAISRILGKPDWQQKGNFGDARPVCMYRRERVLEAEAAGKIRYRAVPFRRTPTEKEFFATETRTRSDPGQLQPKKLGAKQRAVLSALREKGGAAALPEIARTVWGRVGQATPRSLYESVRRAVDGLEARALVHSGWGNCRVVSLGKRPEISIRPTERVSGADVEREIISLVKVRPTRYSDVVRAVGRTLRIDGKVPVCRAVKRLCLEGRVHRDTKRNPAGRAYDVIVLA